MLVITMLVVEIKLDEIEFDETNCDKRKLMINQPLCCVSQLKFLIYTLVEFIVNLCTVCVLVQNKRNLFCNYKKYFFYYLKIPRPLKWCVVTTNISNCIILGFLIFDVAVSARRIECIH